MDPKHQRFVADLKRAGIEREIMLLDEHTHTAAAVAGHLGCEVAAIANSLVFDCEGEALLIMSSGAGRVDTTLVSAALGRQKLKRATPDFVKQATGQVIGGVAPAGHPAPLRTVIDTSLRDHDELWVAAGTDDSLMPLSYAELLRLTGGTELVVRSSPATEETSRWSVSGQLTVAFSLGANALTSSASATTIPWGDTSSMASGPDRASGAFLSCQCCSNSEIPRSHKSSSPAR